MLDTSSIIACIDGSHLSEAVCDYASWAAEHTQAPVTLLHTIERQSTLSATDYTGSIGMGSRQQLLQKLIEAEEERSRLLIQQGELMLAAASQRVQAVATVKPQVLQRHDGLSNTLIELENHIRLLVIGVRGQQHEGQTQAVGGQLETVIRAIHRPILVVNHEFVRPHNFMIAYDGSKHANKAIDMVATGSLFTSMPCHLVHVTSEKSNPEQDQQLQLAADRLTQADIEVQLKHLSGDVTQALTQYQHEQDIGLTLMGAFSHNRLRDWLLGSFTHNMLTQATRPLLLLR